MKAFLGVIVGLLIVAPRAAAPVQPWQQIDYPALSIPGTDQQQMTVRLSSGGHSGEPVHLRFDLQWGAMMRGTTTAPARPAPIADARSIHVALHTADGKRIAADPSPADWIGVSNAGGVTFSLIYTFPWSRNALDEAWIELTAAGRKYWIELPYGFARNPADPELPDRTRGTPEFPAVMRALGDTDILVPWRAVQYDLGTVHGGWRLRLDMESAGDGRAKVTLEGDRTVFTLDSPRVTAEIQTADGTKLTGRETARLLDPKRNVFEFQRWVARPASRTWGTVTIDVDGERTSLTVPSSLFSLLHGITDPGNTHRLVVLPERR